MIKKLFIIFVLVGGCTTSQHKQSNVWILPTVETHPEERTVATRHPVIPVIIEKLD
tara:strand:+ start:41 stop:208 length:168 start_codon:yes stop_codon:yes gene_type:complete